MNRDALRTALGESLLKNQLSGGRFPDRVRIHAERHWVSPY